MEERKRRGNWSETTKVENICCNKCKDQQKCRNPEKAICPPNYRKKRCKGMSYREICVKKGPAVVSITTLTNLTTKRNPCMLYPKSNCDGFKRGLTYGQDFVTLRKNSVGSFIENHLILCPAASVTVPPNITGRFNPYPFMENQIGEGYNGRNHFRVGRILVTVYNVNGTKQALVYEAELFTVYGLGNIALININMECFPFNSCNPCILQCHPYFKFGCSRAYHCGEPIVTVTDSRRSSFMNYKSKVRPLFNGEEEENEESLDNNRGKGDNFNDYPNPLQQAGMRSFVAGHISYHRAMDPQGLTSAELVTTDLNVGSYTQGSPFINKFGRLVGMQTWNVTRGVSGVSNITLIPIIGSDNNLQQTKFYKIEQSKNGDGIVAGPSQFFIQPIINKMIETINAGDCLDGFKIIESCSGNYLLYTHGYLGISYRLVTALDMTMNFDYKGEMVPDICGHKWGSGPVKKHVIGIRVTGIAGGDAVSGIIIPGKYTKYTVNGSFSNSKINGELCMGDIITHINGVAIGTLGCQITPLLVLYNKHPGSCVTLTVAKQNDGFCKLCNIRVELTRLPNFINNPWDKYPDELLHTLPLSLNYFANEYPQFGGVTFYPSI